MSLTNQPNTQNKQEISVIYIQLKIHLSKKKYKQIIKIALTIKKHNSLTNQNYTFSSIFLSFSLYQLSTKLFFCCYFTNKSNKYYFQFFIFHENCYLVLNRISLITVYLHTRLRSAPCAEYTLYIKIILCIICSYIL